MGWPRLGGGGGLHGVLTQNLQPSWGEDGYFLGNNLKHITEQVG